MRVGLCVLLVILGVVLPAMSQRPPPPAYADSWAVEVSGGKAKAQELAAKHGFVFRGQVSECPLFSVATDSGPTLIIRVVFS